MEINFFVNKNENYMLVWMYVVLFYSLFQALQSLVDYDEDSDDEQTPEEDVNSLNSSSKRQKFDNTWTQWTLLYIQKVLHCRNLSNKKLILSLDMVLTN